MKLLIPVIVAVSLAATSQAKAPPNRAAPPTWSRDVLDAFFDDVRDHLVGERPAPASSTNTQLEVTPATDGEQSAGGFAWSKRLSAETLSQEIKRVANSLRTPLSNPSRFKSGGFQECRQGFAQLAVLFGILAEHDKKPRWQTEAAGLRTAFAKTAANCKVANDQSYRDATLRKQDLDGLLRGEKPMVEAEELQHWSELADRELVMRWMEASFEKVGPMLANEKAFSRESDKLHHETQLLSALGEIIQREDYDYWDDDSFLEYARALQTSASEVSEAAGSGDYQRARTAAGRIGQSCSQCHEDYRG
ncbi:cytochrome c [Adhaeretor mobilis]|uniref:Cytochrome C n=1 Tax=Adhaeretor mobilis TaxID=1930276 RepID=A0A517MT81_9BACT|nr:cytochrome c [Adhaeretor mobilis]QDS98085.1 Cytochrome C' [Adhaeretor mobilis]